MDETKIGEIFNTNNNSPFNNKVKLLDIQSKQFDINNKSNIDTSKIPLCNIRNQIFLKNPIKTESIIIDLNSNLNNHQKIVKYYSDKKV